jgi:hypothetical protein
MRPSRHDIFREEPGIRRGNARGFVGRGFSRDIKHTKQKGH